MAVKLLSKCHLESLSLKGGCTGLSEPTLVKMPHCWKSHVAAQLCTSILAHCRMHHLPVKHTSTDSNFVNILLLRSLHLHFLLIYLFSCLILSGMVLEGYRLDGKMEKIGYPNLYRQKLKALHFSVSEL